MGAIKIHHWALKVWQKKESCLRNISMSWKKKSIDTKSYSILSVTHFHSEWVIEYIFFFLCTFMSSLMTLELFFLLHWMFRLTCLWHLKIIIFHCHWPDIIKSHFIKIRIREMCLERSTYFLQLPVAQVHDTSGRSIEGQNREPMWSTFLSGNQLLRSFNCVQKLVPLNLDCCFLRLYFFAQKYLSIKLGWGPACVVWRKPEEEVDFVAFFFFSADSIGCDNAESTNGTARGSGNEERE